MPYLMESPTEACRLAAKSDLTSTIEQLRTASFDTLAAEARCCDVGTGTGIAAQAMLAIKKRSSLRGSVHLFDCSLQRLGAAKRSCRETASCRVTVAPVCGDVMQLPCKDDMYDYTFCRFVFEYLQDTQQALRELIRITRPGGMVVVGDLDYNCLTHFPIDPLLLTQLREIVEELERLGLFDPFAGRKLYSLFQQAGLDSIQMHVTAHHVLYGSIDRRDVLNWEAKVEAIVQLARSGSLALSFNVDSFSEAFAKHLRSGSTFIYTPLIIAVGKRP